MLAGKVFNASHLSDVGEAEKILRAFCRRKNVSLAKFADIAVTVLAETHNIFEEARASYPANDYSYKLVLLKCFRGMDKTFRDRRKDVLQKTTTELQRNPSRNYPEVLKKYEEPGAHSVGRKFRLMPKAKLMCAFVKIEQFSMKWIATRCKTLGLAAPPQRIFWTRLFNFHDFRYAQDRPSGIDPQATGRQDGPRPYKKCLPFAESQPGSEIVPTGFAAHRAK